MKKVILTLAAVMACALCVFSSCKKSGSDGEKVILEYRADFIGGNPLSLEILQIRSDMNAAIANAVEIFQQGEDYRLSYETEANDKAATAACDAYYAQHKNDIKEKVTVGLIKAYAARAGQPTRSVTFKTYVFGSDAD